MERLGKFPQRVQNMYFTYLFLIRATMKIAPLLRQHEYHTASPAETAEIHVRIRIELLNLHVLASIIDVLITAARNS
jgi:ERO1-like protein alpha